MQGNIENRVTLKSLSLRNFKGIKELDINFGEVTTIAGANATGKSTVFDAFTWVLFGKDSHDRTDNGKGGFSVKTVDASGNPIHKLEHAVTAVLDVNGKEVTLTRSLREDWVKPRGKREAELKGHKTAFIYNGVEIKAAEYQKKVSEIIDEQLFKLITNPTYFPSLPWQEQREILMNIAGGVTYEEVAAGRKDFAKILEQLSGRDMAEFKMELAYRKKKVRDELDKCPVQIEAIDKVTPQAPNYEELEKEKAKVTIELEKVEAALSDMAEAMKQQYEKEKGIRDEINELHSRQSEIVFNAKEAATKAFLEGNARRNELMTHYDLTKREMESYDRSMRNTLDNIGFSLTSCRAEVEVLNEKIEKKRKEWSDKNAEVYKESTEGLMCPLYKSLCSDASVLKLDAQTRAKARQSFEERKAAELARINEEGQEIAKKIKEKTAQVKELEEEISTRREMFTSKLRKYESQLIFIEHKLADMPEVQRAAVVPEEIPEWKAAGEKIQALTASLLKIDAPDNSSLKAKKRELTATLDDIKQRLGIREVILKHEEERKNIEKREKELAGQLAELEGQEFAADALNKALIDEVEKRVNGMFNVVKFRMFETLINGGESPTCVAMVNGVKYSDVNSAGKINAGLDIIDTLCRFYGVSAPIFVDNAESVLELYPVGFSQVIRLVVSTDKKLTITY